MEDVEQNLLDRLDTVVAESEQKFGKASADDVARHIIAVCAEFGVTPEYAIDEVADPGGKVVCEVAIIACMSVLTSETFADEEAARTWLDRHQAIKAA